MIQLWHLIVAVAVAVGSGCFALLIAAVKITNALRDAKEEVVGKVAEVVTRVAVLETRIGQAEDRLDKIAPLGANGHAAGRSH